MGWVKNEEVNKLFDKKKEKGQPSIHQIVTFYLLKLGEISVEKKNIFFWLLPNYLNAPPHDPNSGNLVFRTSKFKT